MPRGRHELLEQHGAVAEGLLGLGLRAGERGRKRFGLVDAADGAPATARRRLDHDREADARGVPERLVDGPDGTAAPRRHGHAGCFGEPLGSDPVANQTHHRRVGPDEDDAEPLAQFGELGLLRDEAPPDPDRIGTRLAQGALQRLVVEVAAVERDCLIGVADEHRVALGLRVERDDAYRLGAVDVELAHGVDDPHGGLAAVDDRKAGERALHRQLPIAVRIGARASRPTVAGAGAAALGDAAASRRGDARRVARRRHVPRGSIDRSSPVGTVALTVREPLSRMGVHRTFTLAGRSLIGPLPRMSCGELRATSSAAQRRTAPPASVGEARRSGCGSSRMCRAPTRT